MEFKDRLKETLEKRGLTQTQAAEMVGLAQGQVSRHLLGAGPGRTAYERYLKAFPELREPIAS